MYPRPFIGGMLESWPGVAYARVAVLPDLPKDRSATLFIDDLKLVRNDTE